MATRPDGKAARGLSDDEVLAGVKRVLADVAGRDEVSRPWSNPARPRGARTNPGPARPDRPLGEGGPPPSRCGRC